MSDPRSFWSQAAKELRDGGIEVASAPLFLIMGPLRGATGREIRQVLPRVPRKSARSYDENEPAQVYADVDAIFITWTKLDDPDGFRTLIRSVRADRSGIPPINGVLIQVPFGWLIALHRDRLPAESYRRTLAALRDESGTLIPIFVHLTDLEYEGRRLPCTDLHADFPLDLWDYPGRADGLVSLEEVPRLIEDSIRGSIGDRLVAASYGLAPLRAKQCSDLPANFAWFDWLRDLERSIANLCFLLRMVVIGAYGVEVKVSDPSLPLPPHEFRTSAGPILLGECCVTTDVAQGFTSSLERMKSCHESACWTDVVRAEDQRFSRFATIGYGVIAMCAIGMMIVAVLSH